MEHTFNVQLIIDGKGGVLKLTPVNSVNGRSSYVRISKKDVKILSLTFEVGKNGSIGYYTDNLIINNK